MTDTETTKPPKVGSRSRKSHPVPESDTADTFGDDRAVEGINGIGQRHRHQVPSFSPAPQDSGESPANVDKVREEARQWLEGRRLRASPKTVRRYLQLASWMRNTGMAAEQATNPRTFQVRRAAELMAITRDLLDWTWTKGTAEKGEGLLARAKLLQMVKWSRIKPATPTRRPSKARLSALPTGWVQIMFEAASPRMKSILAVLELSGIRPEELPTTTITIVERDRLAFTVAGAKVGPGHGVAEGFATGWTQREIQVEIDCERARWLAEIVAEVGPLRLDETPQHIKDNVRALAKRLWPRRKAANRPSAYSYRHGFAARQKAAGTDPSTIAVAMGHRSERTQGSYGRPTKDIVTHGMVTARCADPRPGNSPRTPERPSPTRLRPKPGS